MSKSVAEILADLDAQMPGFSAEVVAGLSEAERFAAMYDWSVWRRPKQATPGGDWRVWLILAGRGFGKTRTGAEFVREQVISGKVGRVALVGATAADVRDTMIEGESGLLAVFPPEERPRYEPSKRRVTFHNGATASAFSADEPDRLRGPNHDLAWADELAAWRYVDAWDQLMLGLRLGDHPRVVVTTTPRPTELIRRLARSDDGTVHVTTGSTYENSANLAPDFIAEMRRRYEGTRLGRQELEAQILDDVEGALWDRAVIDETRVTNTPPLRRIVVAIDPAVTSGEKSDETGIVVAGVAQNGEAYVLDDRTMRASPSDWASAAIAAYHRHNADMIVAEANQGGDLVESVLRAVDPRVPIHLVRASRGKRTRAEPVAAIYEQRRAHHVGFFPELEDQLCSWVPDIGSSPDRLDALVWALTDLIVDRARAAPVVIPASLEQASPWRI
jgi:phage terminase large subunit-like protein